MLRSREVDGSKFVILGLTKIYSKVALCTMVIWVFKRGVQKLVRCLSKIDILKENYLILRIGVLVRCQILGVILENKVIQKLTLSMVIFDLKNQGTFPLHQIISL